jgi:hypothetical protein
MPLIFRFVLEYATQNVRENQEGMEISVTYSEIWSGLMVLIYCLET